VFSGVERPHTDELTFFSCHAEAEGVTAKSSVESIDGDERYDADAASSSGGGASIGVRERRLAVPPSAAVSSGLGDSLGRTWACLEGAWASMSPMITIVPPVFKGGVVFITTRSDQRPYRPVSVP
jgi:hypothetical protein